MMTIVDLFNKSVQKYGDNTFILEKKTDQYIGISYKETYDEVCKVAAGLMASGIKKGDRVALLSESRTDWVISELGIMHAGAICVPLSILFKEGSELKFRLEHSGSKWIFVSGNQLEKIKLLMQDLHDLERVVVLDPQASYSRQEIFFNNLKETGEEYRKKNPDKFLEKVNSIDPDDYANICYTSGTTDDPKGVILSHSNYIANIKQALSLIEVPEWWTTLLILPWDHSFAHTVGIYIMMASGASFAAVQSGRTYFETLRNIPDNIREIRPVFMLSAPALAKNFRKGIEKSISAKGRFAERSFRHALKIAYRYNGIGWNRGKGGRILLKPLYKLYDLVFFKNIRAGFGGRLQFFFGGAALLDLELQKFFFAIGIPMLQGYGLTEASPVISGNMMHKNKLGSSGYLVKDLELKICDEEGNPLPTGEKGEIVIRGENVMKGYWNNEKATRESLREGWLYTGDMGYIDQDGFLYVLGRFKSLLISDDGEKYNPEGIEETITDRSPYIEQLMLYNNQSKYTSALLVPNTSALINWAQKKNIDLTEEKGLEAVLKLLESVINQYKKGGEHDDIFPYRWLPAALAILDEPFNMENHLLNSTGKMVRSKIIDYHMDKIDHLYTPDAKDIINRINIDSLKKAFKTMSID
jgi:long-chain acyl-CoA synthetase